MRHLIFGLLCIAVACGLAPAARAQGTSEQREACTPDALKLCADAVPDVARTTACMKAHQAELSPRCKAAFDAEPAPSKTTEARAAAPKSTTEDVAAPVARRRPPMRDAWYARDPDAEVPYVPPRRVIAPPLYSDPGPPLNPGGVPYDELFAGPTLLDGFEALDDPYRD